MYNTFTGSDIKKKTIFGFITAVFLSSVLHADVEEIKSKILDFFFPHKKPSLILSIGPSSGTASSTAASPFFNMRMAKKFVDEEFYYIQQLIKDDCSSSVRQVERNPAYLRSKCHANITESAEFLHMYQNGFSSGNTATISPATMTILKKYIENQIEKLNNAANPYHHINNGAMCSQSGLYQARETAANFSRAEARYRKALNEIFG